MPKPGISWIYFFQIYPCKIVSVLYQLPFKFCFLKQQFSCTLKKLGTIRLCLNVSAMNGYFSAYDFHISSHVRAMGSLHPSLWTILWKNSTLFVDSSSRKKWGLFAWDPQDIHMQLKKSFVVCSSKSFLKIHLLDLLMWWPFESCFVIDNRLSEWEQELERLSQLNT